MTILVDTPVNYGNGRIYAHMVSDSSIKELHQFAKRLGLKKDSFRVTNSGFAHYSINIAKRLRALEMGAKAAGAAEFMKASRSLSSL